MTKSEFLKQLEKELMGNISSSAVKENIDYYDSYFREELENGRSEEEVLEMLGDPWAIAQTVIDMNNGSSGETIYEEPERTYSSENRREKQYQTEGKVHVFGFDTWWKKLLLVLFIVMIVMVIVTVATGIIRLLAPVAIPVLVIMFVIRLFGRRS
ncbi:MAG: DUF1700 domain-containing protein [Ruminococcus sp.]|nr:DUF1700 domain-containing protein [Ruminococcus sp.]